MAPATSRVRASVPATPIAMLNHRKRFGDEPATLTLGCARGTARRFWFAEFSVIRGSAGPLDALDALAS
jgi:hypothetical protein